MAHLLANSTPNERLGRCLTYMNQGLRAWVQKCAQERWGDNWYNELSQSMYLDLTSKQTSIDTWDSIHLLNLHLKPSLWEQCFSRHLEQNDRSYIYELRRWRNDWAHQHIFSDYGYRALDTMERLLIATKTDASIIAAIREERYAVVLQLAAQISRLPSAPPSSPAPRVPLPVSPSVVPVAPIAASAPPHPPTHVVEPSADAMYD